MSKMTPPTTDHDWQTSFLELYDRCVQKYRSGNDDFTSYYNPEDLSFLKSIGYKPRELFDFVEDVVEMGEPSRETALAIAAVRQKYFTEEQGGTHSGHEVTNTDLPARDSELQGFVWLPRIITKARAKLKGELHPDVMFSCGGDRNFLKSHGLAAERFLEIVRDSRNDQEIAAQIPRA